MKLFLIKIVQAILKILACIVLKSKKPYIIGITGSVAKSSTKEAVWSLLKEKFEVGKNEGNLNTEIGVPLAILGFKKSPSKFVWPFFLIWAIFKAFKYLIPKVKYPKMLVLEMAADKPGDIEYLTSFVKPTIGIITAVGPSHLEAFKTIERVAQEKAKLVEVLPREGYAILNQLDDNVAQMVKKTKARVIYFVPDKLNIPYAVAKAVREIFKLKSLPSFKPLKGRMNIVEGINGSIILDDSYNANPLSMEYALTYLTIIGRQHSAKRRIAVLGDMLELGDYAIEGHKKVGRIAKKNCELLLTTGDYAKYIAQEGRGRHFQTKSQLINYLKEETKRGDIILVKASRKMKFEEIVERLKRDVPRIN